MQVGLTFKPVSEVVALGVVQDAVQLGPDELRVVEVLVDDAIFQTKLSARDWNKN